MKKFLSSFQTKSFRVGGYSVVATLILAAILILVNVAVSALPAAYTEIDVSAQQLFSLSEETEKIVNNMEEDITLYWIALDSSKDEYVKNILDRYDALSDHITVKYIDPDVLPSFGKSYDLSTMSNNSIIVEGEKRFRYISTLYEYVYDYDSYNYSTGSYNYTTNFNGENLLTSAINYVVNADLPIVYCTTGHGEGELSDAFKESLTNVNMELRSITLLNEEAIPDDCDVLLMNGISNDISEEERDMIIEYMNKGGRLMLITEAVSFERPNLGAVMANYGIEEVTGLVVEGNSNNYVARYGVAYLLPNIQSHEITKPIIDGNLYIFAPMAGALQISVELPDGVTTKSLLRTSSSSYTKTSNMTTTEKEEGDASGPFELAVIGEKGQGDDSSMAIWFTTSMLLNDSANEVVGGTNGDFFVNCMTYMTGQTDSIAIHSKELTYTYLSMTSMQSTLWSVILAGVVPVLLLAVGIIIFVRRRRR